MKKKTTKKQQEPPSQEFQRFQQLTKLLISVPKKEVEQQQAKREKNKSKAA
jgi:hypothetical protein